MVAMLDHFRGQETTVATAARYMLRYRLTPQDVLAEYEQWLTQLQARMVPAGREARRQPNSTLHSPPSTLKKRHKAGDFARLPATCPRCGAAVELHQLCPQASPIWRTQLACTADGCAWHGKSKMPIDALLAAGAANMKNNVTEG